MIPLQALCESRLVAGLLEHRVTQAFPDPGRSSGQLGQGGSSPLGVVGLDVEL